MYRLWKLLFLLLLSVLAAVALPVLLSSADVAGAASASGLGQLDQGFGAPSGTSGIRSGIAQSSGLSCPTQTNGVSYDMNSGALTGIVAVGKENSYAGTCSSGTDTTGVAALFSNSGVDKWTNENLFSSLDSVKVLPGSSGAIAVAGNSSSEPLIALLSPANGHLLAEKTVPVGSGLIAPSGSFTDVLTGPQITINSGAGAISVDSVYAVGTIDTSSGTELVVGGYGVENPDSASPALVRIKGFGNQGSSSNLYMGSVTQGENVTSAALGSSGNLYVTGNSDHTVSGCSVSSRLGFVSDYKTQVSVNSGVSSYGGTSLNSAFGSGGMFWFNPVSLPSSSAYTCLDTSVNSVLIDANASSGSDPPAVLLGGYERTSSNSGAVNLSVAVLMGLNFNATPDRAFGSSGTVLAAGGTESLNAVNSLAYIPVPGQSSPVPASIVASGINYNQVDSSSNYQVGTSHYSLSGVLDTSFGNSGTSTIPGCTVPGSSCGREIDAQPDGSINLVGAVNLSYKGLSVAQLTDREVELVTSTPNLSVSSSQTPSANFTVTVSAPGNSGLTGIPGGVVADFSTVNGTGKAGYNYQSSSGKVVFPCVASQESITAGSITCNSNLSATISVPTVYPANATGSASFSLQITSVKNAGTASSSASVDVTYPPPPPVTTTMTPTVTTTAPIATTTTTTARQVPSPVTTTTIAKASKSIVPGQGYLVVTAKGQVLSYGDTEYLGSVRSLRPNGQIVAIKATAGNKGYWLVSSTGFIYTFGNAHNYGQPAVKKKKINGFITGFAVTSDGKGYWLVSSTGVVYAFGDAHRFGQLFRKKHIGKPIGIIGATTNRGYWIITSSGMVYQFGKVRNYGSIKPKTLKGIVTGGAVAAGNKGYWLVSSTGVVYAFGDAHNYGYYGHANIKVKSKSASHKKKTTKKAKSVVAKKLFLHIKPAAIKSELSFGRYIATGENREIKSVKKKATSQKKIATKKAPKRIYFVAIETTINYKGYWLLSAVGNVFHYGNAKFYGSPVTKHLKNIKDIVVVP